MSHICLFYVIIFILMWEKKAIMWVCVQHFKRHMWNSMFSIWKTSLFFWFWRQVPSWPHLEASAGTRFGQTRLLVAAWLAALTRMKHSSCEVADWRINKDEVRSGAQLRTAERPWSIRRFLFVTLNRGRTFQPRLKNCSRTALPVCAHLTQPLFEFFTFYSYRFEEEFDVTRLRLIRFLARCTAGQKTVLLNSAKRLNDGYFPPWPPLLLYLIICRRERVSERGKSQTLLYESRQLSD